MNDLVTDFGTPRESDTATVAPAASPAAIETPEATPEVTPQVAAPVEPVSQTAEVAAVVVPAVAPAMTAESIAAAVAGAIPAPVAPVAPVSQEEIDKQLGTWLPDDQFNDSFMKSMTDPDATADDRKNAMHAMRDGLMHQVMTGMQLMLKDQGQQFSEQLNPLQEFMAQQNQVQAVKAFETDYPALKGQDQIVNMVADQIQNTPGYVRQDTKAFFKQVASATEALIKQQNPTFTLGAVPATVTPTTTMPTMASTQTTSTAPAKAASVATGSTPDVW